MLYVIEYPIALNKPIGFSDILWGNDEDLRERQAQIRKQIDDLLRAGAEVLAIISATTEREQKAVFFIWSSEGETKPSVKSQRVTKS
jgi:hypothetical protein